jgi:serine/threonine-protein kinase SRPK3
MQGLSPITMEQCLRLNKAMNENQRDIPAAAGFILRCLTIDPSARPTALELLDDEWLKDV